MLAPLLVSMRGFRFHYVAKIYEDNNVLMFLSTTMLLNFFLDVPSLRDMIYNFYPNKCYFFFVEKDFKGFLKCHLINISTFKSAINEHALKIHGQ